MCFLLSQHLLTVYYYYLINCIFACLLSLETLYKHVYKHILSNLTIIIIRLFADTRQSFL